MNKIRFGVIGTSGIASQFSASALTNKNIEITAVNSRRNDKGNKFIKDNKLVSAKAYEKMEELVGKVDAVYIANPNGVHYEYAKYFLSKNIHVFLEKPTTLKFKETKKLINIAKKKNLIFMEAYKPLHLPQYKIIFEELNMNNYFIANLMLNQYSSRMPDIQKGIYNSVFDEVLGKGSTYDMLIYPVELAISLFGPVKKVSSSSKLLPNRTAISNVVLLTHKNGFITNIICSKETNGSNISEIYSNDQVLSFTKLIELGKITLTDNLTNKTKNIFDTTKKPQDSFAFETSEFIRLINEKDYKTRDYYNEISLESLKVLNTVEKQY